MTARRITLRFAATCARCFACLPPGHPASWEPGRRTVTCLACAGPEREAGAPGDEGQLRFDLEDPAPARHRLSRPSPPVRSVA